MNPEEERRFRLLGTPAELSIVLDCTGSMEAAMRSLPAFLVRYAVWRVANSSPLEALSFVGFDDHYTTTRSTAQWPSPVISQGPTDNLEEFASWVMTTPIGHGDDYAEAITCALSRSRKIHPGAAIWLVTDAVPHGTIPNESFFDAFRDGCPCREALSLDSTAILLVPTTPQVRKIAVVDYWESTGRPIVHYYEGS